MLVRELWLYRERVELSAASLAAKTGYSASSWQRYFAGRLLPPWEAVDALGRLAGADRGRLRVMWEAAADAWNEARSPREPADDHPVAPGTARRADPSGEPGRDRGPTGIAGRGRPRTWSPVRRKAVVAGAVLAGAGLAFAALLGYRWQTSPTAHPPLGAPPGAPAWPWALHLTTAGPGPGCGPDGCRGRDPYRQGCDRDAVTVHRLRALGRTLSLRWSPSCDALWAEVQPADGTSRLSITADDGDRRTATEGAAWTTMIAGPPGAARAVVTVAGHQLGASQFDSWSDPVSGGTGPK
jgi:helix-turn-helix protein/uncharacterized protein DUF2690